MDVGMYAVIVKNEVKDFLVLTLEDALQEAKDTYGVTASIREAWYGEWECGEPETGGCWYDENGIHHFRGGSACDECGSLQPTHRLTPANEHGERFCAVCE